MDVGMILQHMQMCALKNLVIELPIGLLSMRPTYLSWDLMIMESFHLTVVLLRLVLTAQVVIQFQNLILWLTIVCQHMHQRQGYTKESIRYLPLDSTQIIIGYTVQMSMSQYNDGCCRINNMDSQDLIFSLFGSFLSPTKQKM